jgi:hypothetical protein
LIVLIEQLVVLRMFHQVLIDHSLLLEEIFGQLILNVHFVMFVLDFSEFLKCDIVIRQYLIKFWSVYDNLFVAFHLFHTFYETFKLIIT